MCGLEIQKATQIITRPIHAKLGFMHKLTGMYTHNNLSVDYEALEDDGRNKIKGIFKVEWLRDTLCGLEVQKATIIVILSKCEA